MDTAITSQSNKTNPFFQSETWEGAFWKVFSYLCFAISSGIIRYWTGGSSLPVSETLSTYTLLFFQSFFAALFLLPWLFKNGKISLITRHPKLNFLRIFSAICGLGLWYMTLRFMPIAEGVAITFTGPIFAVLGARIFLKEKMGLQRTIAVIISLVGAYIIIRPHNALLGQTSSFGLYALLPLGSAILLALDKLYTRKITVLGEKPETLVISFLAWMVPFSFMIAAMDWVTPSVVHWKWLVLLGLVTALMHYSFVRAYMLAEVSFLTPIGYTKFFFSAAVGYFCFGEFPKNNYFWIGISIIFFSILLLIELPRKSLVSNQNIS